MIVPLLLKTGLRLAAITLLLTLLFVPMSAATAATLETSDFGVPLEQVLTPDGHLNIPPGFVGSIDPAGYYLASGPDETPRFAPSADPPNVSFATDNSNWDPRFSTSYMSSLVRALVWDGANLYAGGDFLGAGSCVGCNYIARWDGNEWQPLGNGVNNMVFALTLVGSDLYVGGDFNGLCNNADCSATAANGVNRLARWDGANWHALGFGVNNLVRSLSSDGTNLYAGGSFTRLCANADCSAAAAANGVNRVARWDGANWQPLGFGVDSVVFDLVSDGTNLYASGGFTRRCVNADCSATAANGVNRVARWDGANWQPLGFGLNSTVTALSSDGTNLYTGGSFTLRCANPDCSSTAAANGVNRVARWDGANWQPLGFGVNNTVLTLSSDGANLYAGGNFTRLCNNATCTATIAANGVNHVARWDGANWQPLGFGVNNSVFTLSSDGTNLYAGGVFARLCDNADCSVTAANGINHLARWDDANWHSLGTGGQGTDSSISALAWDGNYLYAGGQFRAAGLCVGCNRIARWDGTAWHSLGHGLNNWVRTLNSDGTNLYVGGTFTRLCANADCSATVAPSGFNRVARWDGANWHVLGFGVNGTVTALSSDGTNLYTGGSFTRLCANADCSTLAVANGVNRLARWDGANWHSLSFGVNSGVEALSLDGTNLYAGGDFTLLCANADCSATAAANGVNRLARWDGANWHALSFGMDNTVSALSSDGTNLYVGGWFTRLCSNADCSATIAANGVNRLARWDGGSWHALGFGVNNWVNALSSDGTNLYAGGVFTLLCTNADCSVTGNTISRVGRWDGANWHTMGNGLSGTALALAWDGDSLYHSLYVGGGFGVAGNTASARIARWRLAAVWDGEGGDNNAATAANWSGDVVPSSTDVIIFDKTSSKEAVLNAGFPTTLRGMVIENSYGGVITQTNNLALTADLQAHGGVLHIADPDDHSFTVGGEIFHTGGVLRQARPVNNASVPFLLIDDGAANVKYRGVDLDTTGNANDLGDVTVSVRAVNSAAGSYCTVDGDGSPAYADRCYQISPINNGPATVRLWALTDELNGIAEDDLSVYRFVSGSWVELDDGRLTGNDGNGYSFAEGNTAGFSHFLLGDRDDTPTAVSLQHIQAQANSTRGAIAVIFVMLCLLSGVALSTLRRE